jgi:dienelactone hydrolase
MMSTTLEYRDGDVRLKGVLVQPEKRSAGSAVVLFPDARGVGAHAIECAGRLAALGYLTLVADLYGEGILARASPRPADAANIKAKVLICHGAADPLVPPAEVAAFEEEMGRTEVDCQLHVYGGAVHSFTNPEAGAAGNPAFAYNETADRRSWAAMLGLLQEAFA